MKNLKYSEILSANKKLGKNLKGNKYNITVLSNIITSQLNDILEYSLRLENINAHVKSGNYDNILQDSMAFKNSQLVIIFWELSNIIEGFQYKADSLPNKKINQLVSKVKSEIDLVLTNLKSTSLVIFNKFSSLVFNYDNIYENTFNNVSHSLNKYIKEKKSSNVIFIDIDKIISKGSVSKSIDLRFFYSSKALYTIEFYKNYVESIKPIILSAYGKAKKALIFDCDNTLWQGILGEDGFDGIKMSNKDQNGTIFEEVQHIALNLNKQGILLGLCSKNNPQDVDEVINNHPDMNLREKNITIKKINWNDKVTNLKAIAKELNIGLDSLVYVEDSDFEVNLIRELLPQVTVLQVPKKLHEYPRMLRENLNLFFNISRSKEDLKKTGMYKQQVKRAQEKSKFDNFKDYLKSLELKLTIYINNKSIIPRISQMTQKTNQFNLTTKRYTEADIQNFVVDDKYKVIAFNVRDKFGDYGITGLSIIKLDYKNKNGDIDSLLMSCRIIGRNIELAFFDFLIDYLQKFKLESIKAKYIKTLKNEQVADFYDRLELDLIKSSEKERSYNLQFSGYKRNNLKYIKIKNGRSN